MIDELQHAEINLKNVPAKDRERLCNDLHRHGHTALYPFPLNSADLAGIIIDYSGKMIPKDWDDNYPGPGVYFRTPWTYTLVRTLLDQEAHPTPEVKLIDHCNCKMTIGGIIHEKECKNFLDLRAYHPWGIK